MAVRLGTICALALLALAVTASSGAAARPAHAPILGVVPHVGAASVFSPLSATRSGPLVLQTQPCVFSSFCWTMRTNTTYAIYWVPSDYSVDANYETDINRYLTDVAADSGTQNNVYSVATQYYDNAAAIQYKSTFAGSYVDTNPFPANGCDVGGNIVCLTDVQLQDEIQAVLTAKGWQAGPDTLFFLMTPDGVASCFDGSAVDCTTTDFCAYHSGFYNTDNAPVIYANEPYDGTIPNCNNQTGQGSPNDADADATINTISHEHNESITDPWGDAWYSNDAGGDENGDLCAWDFGTEIGKVNGQSYNQVINGHKYSLQQEYSNDGAGCLLGYTPSVAPTTVAPPVVSGTAGQDALLFSSEGSWANAPSGYAYKWQRCAANGSGCADIVQAVGATYRLTSADVGYTVRAEVSAHNAAGTAASYVASALTGVVVALPSATAAPVVSGVAAVGKQLSTTNGTWNTTASFTYAWLRCDAAGANCAVIPGAAAAAYVVSAADAGHRLEARVSATNAAGTTTAVSNAGAVVVNVPAASATPHISGRARVGKKLTASKGSWSGTPAAYRFQWLRCSAQGGSCKTIGKATKSAYKVTKKDAKHRLRVRVTAVNGAGLGIAISRPTARVPAVKRR